MINAIEISYNNLVYLHGEVYKIQDFQDCEVVNPIPLTEEWLLKMGFEEAKGHGGYKAFSIDSFVVLKTNGVNIVFQASNYCANQVEVSTVHQLQNLYHALTGEELTIKE